MHRKSSASKNAATVNLAASPPADAADEEEEEEDAAAPSPTPPVVVDHEVGEREKAEAPMPAPFVWCPPLPPFVIDALIDAALDICAEQHVFFHEKAWKSRKWEVRTRVPVLRTRVPGSSQGRH